MWRTGVALWPVHFWTCPHPMTWQRPLTVLPLGICTYPGKVTVRLMGAPLRLSAGEAHCNGANSLRCPRRLRRTYFPCACHRSRAPQPSDRVPELSQHGYSVTPSPGPGIGRNQSGRDKRAR